MKAFLYFISALLSTPFDSLVRGECVCPIQVAEVRVQRIDDEKILWQMREDEASKIRPMQRSENLFTDDCGRLSEHG